MLEVLIARREAAWYAHSSAERAGGVVMATFYLVFWASVLLQKWYAGASAIAALAAFSLLALKWLHSDRVTRGAWEEYRGACDEVRVLVLRIIAEGTREAVVPIEYEENRPERVN